jgi:FkbH-like protein
MAIERDQMSSDLYTGLAWLPQPPADFAALCRALSATQADLGMQLTALASYSLDSNQMDCLAELQRRARSDGASFQPLAPFRLGLLSNSNVDFIVPALIATAPRYRLSLEVVTGDFGQFLQDALSPDSAINREAPDAVLVALDYRAFPLVASPGVAKAAYACAQRALDQLNVIRQSISRNAKAICILQTIAPPPETLFGSLDGILPGSLSQMIGDVNSGIATEVAGPGDIVLDVAHLASTVGLANWHSPRDWNLGKFPFSDAVLPLYADHVCRVISALRGNSRRCLILDLDNTLWGGVIGDDGSEGIQIAQGDPTGEAFLAVQRLALDLRSRGVVLAVCSKNEDAIARIPFRDHPEMLLRESHIAVFQANWRDKPSNIKAIAAELSLGLESMVFLDDNPAERDAVRQTLPAVAVPELPDDPSLFARTLNAAGYFESVSFSPEDLARADFYRDNARRVTLQQESGDLDAYLKSLEMELVFQPFDQIGRARIAQLINKSNQFNLTTRRYSETQVLDIERDPACFSRQVRLSDRFGDNGMICVVICRETLHQWEIDTWLMSCRVLGRRVEQMVLGCILEHAKKRGIHRLRGVYIPTERNSLVSDHYKTLGFSEVGQTESGTKFYEVDVAAARLATAPIKTRCLCCKPEKQDHVRPGLVAEAKVLL